MRKIELLEATGILTRMMNGLLGVVGGPMTGRSDFDLRRAVGDINAEAEELIAVATLPKPLLNAFALAQQAGGTFDAFDRLRRQLLAEVPISNAAIAVTQLGTRFCLSTQARIVAATAYVSRQDADVALGRINDAFAPAEEDAADQHDAGTYQALIALHGATVRDLVDRSMLLPRIVNYTLPQSVPALTLANAIYPDDIARNDDRSDEIIMENKVVHPAFMPRQGIALSA
jgi:prophage DNA circulation protein